jgi:hypothetical protein
VNQTRQNKTNIFKECILLCINTIYEFYFLVKHTHEYDTIEKRMKILHIEKKSQILNTYERFNIYEISK